MMLLRLLNPRKRRRYRKKRKQGLFFKVCKSYFKNAKEKRELKEKYKDYDKKMYSMRCNIITSTMVILSTFFVLVNKNLFYAFPLLTCVYPFLRFSEGINNDINNPYKDLDLYNKIIKLNLLLFISMAIFNSQEYLFFNILIIITLSIPMYLGNLNKRYDLDECDE